VETSWKIFAIFFNMRVLDLDFHEPNTQKTVFRVPLDVSQSLLAKVQKSIE
jgi:hypothetical protein